MTWRRFQAAQKVVSIGDQFVSYLDDGTGEPLVLLHGIPTWSYLWTPVLSTLTRTHRVLAPDLIGFGFSDKRDSFDRSIARQTDIVDAWMGHVGIESAVVVGHDIGGGVALRLAVLFPHRVRRLCVINSVSYDSWPIELMLQFGHPLANRRLSAMLASRLMKAALLQGFARRPPSAVIEGLLAPYRTEVGKLSLIRNAAALNTNLTTELTNRLPRLTIQTLVLWGEDDRFQPVRYGERLARVFQARRSCACLGRDTS
jgi:pimeloyl-ACP methyl ester carboxylesterase